MKSTNLTIIASSIAMMFSSMAMAEELPTTLVTDLQAAFPGITVGTDGQITLGNINIVPLFPSNYNPSSTNARLADIVAQPDGSYVAGGLQFVFMQNTPGELPRLPDNLVPLPGNTLPSNFNPPAGFVPNANVPLPSGVTVPPKPPVSMVEDMVNAGLLPRGLVTFNSDGSVSVNGGGSYLPFVPSASQQGLLQSGNQPRIGVDAATGAFTFPDGTQLVPIVSGSTPGEVTLPSGFTPPTNVSLPSGVNLPPQFSIPPTMPLPAGISLPAGVTIPSNYQHMIPPGTVLPPGAQIPSGVAVSPDVVVPPGIMLPPGTNLGSGSLPVGTQVLPNGSVVIPGTQIPAGVTPPSTWTPPSGVAQSADGSYYVPPPPVRGFTPPPAPLRVNADGSTVVPAPPAGVTPPAGSTVNADGTITLPPPSFIGMVGTNGTIQQPTGAGAQIPTGFQPQIQQGMTLPGGTFNPASINSSGQITMPLPPAGVQPPTGATCTATGCTVPPPSGFIPPTTNATGQITIQLPPGATPPPGAVLNPDGTVTFQAPPPPTGTTPPPPTGTTPPPPTGTTPPPPTGTTPPPPTGTTPP